MNSQEILARIPARHTGTQKEPNMYAIGVSKHGAIHFHMEIEGELYITTLRVKSTAKSKVKTSSKTDELKFNFRTRQSCAAFRRNVCLRSASSFLKILKEHISIRRHTTNFSRTTFQTSTFASSNMCTSTRTNIFTRAMRKKSTRGT